MLNRLKARCDGTHTHASLLDRKAKLAAIWLEAFCIDILKGIRDTNIVAEAQAEIIAIEMEARCINSIVFRNEFRADSSNSDYRVGFPVTSSRGPKGSPDGIFAHVGGSQWGRVTKYFDEVTHAELPGHLVKAARAEDIE